MKIKSITKISRNNEEVYNLEVKDNHNYYANDILVKNCHQCSKNNKVSNFIESLDCRFLFGFTGTLPEDIQNLWSVIGIFGTVLHEEFTKRLQDIGILATINIIPIKFIHKKLPNIQINDQNGVPREYIEMYTDEIHWFETNDESNQMIVQIVSKLPGNTLLLFDHTLHGKTLFEQLELKDKFFVNGNTKLDDRKDLRELMEKSQKIVAVSNIKCFGTGINIKNLQNIVFGMSGKGITKIIQAVGRGLRLKEGKTKLNLLDIHHNLKYSERHFERRCQLYKQFFHKEISIKDLKKIEISDSINSL